MASNVKEEGTQYASTGREESSEEQRELTAVYNIRTAIQKRAFEAMEVLQSEMGGVKVENDILKEFCSR